MMETILKKFKLENDKEIYIETYPIYLEGEGADAAIKEKVVTEFKEIWTDLKPALSIIVSQIEKLTPDKLEIKFGVKIAANFRAIIAGGSGEANFEIKLVWNK